MADFNGLIVTDAGKQFLSKCISDGTTPIKITRVIVGDGHLAPGQTRESMTALVNFREDMEVMSTPYSIIAPGHVTIEASLSSAQIGAGFTLREVGVIVEDPNGTEILYAYDNAGDNPSYIPTIGGSVAALNVFRVNIMIHNAPNVVIDVAPFGAIDYALETQTSTAGQAVFTLNNLKAFGLSVFINGTETINFTRTNAVTVTIDSPVSAGAMVTFRQIVLRP